jgi:AraC family transcriptional regulator of adaptative response/methylated-DNA-[protein]-cysteine methyltransferase
MGSAVSAYSPSSLRFLQFLTAEYARGLLKKSPSVLGAAYEAGLSGPGRLHDLIVNVYAAHGLPR